MTRTTQKIFPPPKHVPGTSWNTPENLECHCGACCSHLLTHSTTTTPLHVWEGTMCSHFPIADAQLLPCPNMYSGTARMYSK